MHNKLSRSIVKQKNKKSKKNRKSKTNTRNILSGGSMEVANTKPPAPDILTKEYLKRKYKSL